jgi:Bacteriocin-protection, YdeI or OmpD-Associated
LAAHHPARATKVESSWGEDESYPSQRKVDAGRAAATHKLGEERPAVHEPQQHDRRGKQDGCGGPDEPRELARFLFHLVEPAPGNHPSYRRRPRQARELGQHQPRRRGLHIVAVDGQYDGGRAEPDDDRASDGDGDGSDERDLSAAGHWAGYSTSANEITTKAAIIKAYVREAVAAEKAGMKVETKPPEFPVPEELKGKFRNDPRFKRAFEALTPGRQRGYLFHFAGAKQSGTRTARIEKAMPAIFEGRGFLERR